MTDSPDPVRRADLAALGLRHKSVDVEFKALGDDGSFSAYFAVFGNEDRQGDVLEPRSVRNAGEFLRDGWIAWNHLNHLLPIAYPTELTQDGTGVLVKGVFHSTPEAQAVRTVARERMAAGKSVKGSIGYTSADESFEKVNGRTVRRLKSIDLYECSFVNLAANPRADIAAVKSAAADIEDPMPPASEPSDTKAQQLMTAVKEWLGLAVATKKGRAISKANHAALKTFAAAMDEHAGKTAEHCKTLQAHGEQAKALAAEMKAYLKAFDPDADEDDDSADEPKPTKQVVATIESLKQRALLGRGHQSRP